MEEAGRVRREIKRERRRKRQRRRKRKWVGRRTAGKREGVRERKEKEEEVEEKKRGRGGGRERERKTRRRKKKRRGRRANCRRNYEFKASNLDGDSEVSPEGNVAVRHHSVSDRDNKIAD